MRSLARIVALLVCACVLCCSRAKASDEVVVFAAASTTDAMQAIASEWKAQGGGDVRFSFGPSSDLSRQIEAGARVDLFLSADVAKVDALVGKGLVRPGDRRDLLSNQLVVVVPGASRRSIEQASDLASLDRVALADPDAVPAGIYAKSWLIREGAWERVSRVVVPTLDVRAALAAVEAETVDAAIVYRTDALVSKRVRIALTVSRDRGAPIVYPLARTSSSTNALAGDFFLFLSSPTARATFERFGFVVL